jgi:hypothetical protein
MAAAGDSLVRMALRAAILSSSSVIVGLEPIRYSSQSKYSDNDSPAIAARFASAP